MLKTKKYGLHLQPLYLNASGRLCSFPKFRASVWCWCGLSIWGEMHLLSLLVPFWPASTVCILKKFVLDLHQSRCGISDCLIRIFSFMSCEWGRHWDRRNTWNGLIWRRTQVNYFIHAELITFLGLRWMILHLLACLPDIERGRSDEHVGLRMSTPLLLFFREYLWCSG